MRVDLTHCSNNVYLDTNVFVYVIDSCDPRKHKIARDVLELLFQRNSGVFSAQVLAEWRNVMIRKYAQQVETDFRSEFLEWLSSRNPLPVTGKLICDAEQLTKRYSLSPYDSMHIQAALNLNCQYFLSEDMQDGLVINQSMEIVNPFGE